MAIIQTDFTPVEKYIPYTGLTQLERTQSGIARAEFQYYAVNEDWPATSAGEQRLLKTQITLPSGYGYVITDCYANVTQSNDLPKAEAVAELQIQPSGTLGPNIIVQLPGYSGRQNSAGTTAIGSISANDFNANFPSWRGAYGSISYALREKPTILLYDFDDGTKNSLVSFTLAEQASQEAECQLQFFLRLIQYDVDQSYNYVLNSPQLTR